jgi:tetratricopeptide (TPR) repeat protein
MSAPKPPKHQVIDWNPNSGPGQGPSGSSNRNRLFVGIAIVAVVAALGVAGFSWHLVQQKSATGPVMTAEQRQELAYKNRGRAELAYENASRALGAARALPVNHEGLLQEIALIEKAFLLAETDLKNGNYAAAADALATVIASTEEFTETVEMQRNAHKRYDDLYARIRGIDRYKAFDQADYDNAFTAVGEGRHLLESGSFRAAWQAFDEAEKTLDRFDTNKAAFVAENLRSGQLALKQGDGPAAEAAFQSALQYDDANEAGLRGLARAEQAAQVFELLTRARIAEDNADYDTAIAAYDEAFALDEFNATAQQGASRARADQKEAQFNGFLTAAETAATDLDWAAAIENYEQALEVYPKRTEIADALAQAEEEHHAAQVHDTLAEAYDLERDYLWDEARVAYERLLELEPDYQDAIDGLIRVGRTVRALLEYETLIQRAELHLLANEYQSAIRTFNEAMQTKPSYLALSPEVKEIRRVLELNSKPVDITFVSDSKTWVSITNFQMLGKITEKVVSLPPGDYEVIGRRKHFKDVLLLLKVRPRMSTNIVSVICRTKADS